MRRRLLTRSTREKQNNMILTGGSSTGLRQSSQTKKAKRMTANMSTVKMTSLESLIAMMKVRQQKVSIPKAIFILVRTNNQLYFPFQVYKARVITKSWI